MKNPLFNVKFVLQIIKNMNYHTRKWVKPEDLNPNHSLFGGRLLQWIDEEAALYAIIQLENTKVVTKFISEINFVSSAKQEILLKLVLKLLTLALPLLL